MASNLVMDQHPTQVKYNIFNQKFVAEAQILRTCYKSVSKA